ncbi:MAG: hypothetical protein JSV54_04005, partial [Chloroflexota bacterium]
MRRPALTARTIGILIIVALIVLPNPACSTSETAPSSQADNTSEIQSLKAENTVVGVPTYGWVAVELSLSNAPKLGYSAELIFVMTSRKPTDNLTIEVTLPEGIERVSGDLYWHGDIPEGGTRNEDNWDEKIEHKVVLRAVIKAVKSGDWVIQARASYYPYGYLHNEADNLYLQVTADSAKMSRMPFYKPPKISWSEYAPVELELKLSLSKAPRLNETAEVTCIATVKPNPNFSGPGSQNTANVTVEIDLPEGFIIVSGNSIWG